MYEQMSLENFVSFLSPLAERMRPRNLDEYIGQDHVLGKGKPLRRSIENDNLSSMILWGPPGVGKTSLAMLIADITNSNFESFSAVSSGIKEVKEIISKAKENKMYGIRTILFVDEIHRFNKSQQDVFLPDVEKGNIILIGATTENPSYEINSALLSRSMVVMLKPISTADIIKLLKNAIYDKRGFGYKKIDIRQECLEEIAVIANGDARSALNIFENVVNSAKVENDVLKIDDEVLQDCIQKKILFHSKNGDEHYNLISALHKSMRNSDCDAAIYWLARILEAGEDPLYVARRLIRFASEDIGLADLNALPQAIAAYQAIRYIGMPECTVNLAQAVIFLSTAPKSNSLYIAYEAAKNDAYNTNAEEVPLHLRNATTSLMKAIGYGKGYKYAHDFENKTTDMRCLPDNLKDKKYYTPISVEEKIRVQNQAKFFNYTKKVEENDG